MLVDTLGPLDLRELNPERRHRRQAGDTVSDYGLDDVLRQEVVEQHRPRTGMERSRQLTEPGVEGQWQRREQYVGAVVLKV